MRCGWEAGFVRTFTFTKIRLFSGTHCLEVVRVGLIVALAYLEDEPVEDAGDQATGNGTHPVDPVIGPHALDNGGAKGSGWVHAGTTQFDL